MLVYGADSVETTGRDDRRKFSRQQQIQGFIIDLHFSHGSRHYS